MGSSWYLYKDGQQQGPFSSEELKHRAESGAFGTANLVWTEGMENWARADQVKGLFAAAPPPPAPSPAPPPSSAPTYQPRGPASYRAGPAPKRGKGGLAALIVILVVLVLGGGYFAANKLFLQDDDQVAAPGNGDLPSDAIEPDQDAGGLFNLDSTGLWAPLAPLSQEILDMALEAGADINEIKAGYEQMIAEMPGEGEIPYPAYPNAYAYMYMEPQEMSHGTTLPSIMLVTVDPMDAVFEFYKERLPGWDTDDNPAISVLWQGDEGDKMDAYGYLIPAILISDGPGFFGEMTMPEAQTSITVVYTTD